jgi:hypothetical protein
MSEKFSFKKTTAQKYQDQPMNKSFFHFAESDSMDSNNDIPSTQIGSKVLQIDQVKAQPKPTWFDDWGYLSESKSNSSNDSDCPIKNISHISKTTNIDYSQISDAHIPISTPSDDTTFFNDDCTTQPSCSGHKKTYTTLQSVYCGGKRERLIPCCLKPHPPSDSSSSTDDDNSTSTSHSWDSWFNSSDTDSSNRYADSEGSTDESRYSECTTDSIQTSEASTTVSDYIVDSDSVTSKSSSTSLTPPSPDTIKYGTAYNKRKLNSTLSEEESDKIEPSQKRIKTQQSPIKIEQSPSSSKLNVTLSQFNRSPSNDYSVIDTPQAILPSELVRRVTQRLVKSRLSETCTDHDEYSTFNPNDQHAACDVAGVIGDRIRNDQVEYLIDWQPTWITAENCNCPLKIAEYINRKFIKKRKLIFEDDE